MTGSEFEVKGFRPQKPGDDERYGFVVHLVGDHDGPTKALCYEGFQVSKPQGGIIETDVLEIHNVSVAEELRGKGIGTRIIGHALSEGVSRGFRLARLEVSNPRIASIMEKLVVEGGVLETHYVLKSAEELRTDTTQQVLESTERLGGAEAIDLLISMPLSEEGMNYDWKSDQIECVVRL